MFGVPHFDLQGAAVCKGLDSDDRHKRVPLRVPRRKRVVPFRATEGVHACNLFERAGGNPGAVVLYLHAGNPTPTSTPHAPEPNGYGRVACPLHRFQGVVHELFHDVAAPVVGRLPG